MCGNSVIPSGVNIMIWCEPVGMWTRKTAEWWKEIPFPCFQPHPCLCDWRQCTISVFSDLSCVCASAAVVLLSTTESKNNILGRLCAVGYETMTPLKLPISEVLSIQKAHKESYQLYYCLCRLLLYWICCAKQPDYKKTGSPRTLWFLEHIL